ncbi:AAEL005193-PA [Aedes aegypti]|uniref:AAEL005193-PA n=1 Tax=Aedes aegypti TaxID=7159 RepID=Q17AS3_AEDAE|nr:AAEL005193-PA [Aedes aegypti]
MFSADIRCIILICCASFLSMVFGSANNATHTKQCLIDMLNQCPPNSSCDEGLCVCLHSFKQNPEYNEQKNNDFCIEVDATLSLPGNKSITYDKIYRKAPEPHHILGGILIPVSAVIVILATIVLAKKTQLMQRIRLSLFSNRPRRPAYEDVVLVGYEQ